MSARAGILGAIVGDAIGVPYEFKSRSEIADNPATDMIGFGTYNQPPGTWSDDSSLLLCLLSSLCNGYDLNDIAGNFVDWYFADLWQPHGIVFDIGISTRDVICRLKEGENPKFSGNVEERSNGNGSLMRILPMAYFLKDTPDPKTRYQFIYDVSGVTHAHVRSKLCCYLYIDLALRLTTGMDKNKAFIEAQAHFREFTKELGIAEVELMNFNRILSANFPAFSRREIYGSGYVLHCLEAAIWCLLNSDGYSETVLAAVNLGDDTDTTATVAGGLAGIYFGEKSIPEHWINQIARIDEIEQEIRRFDRRYSL